jgi:ABC-type sugar transport system ATPase subunit
MTPLLLAQNIDKHFGGVMALQSARFALQRGEVHALMGENGAGKTTLARILSGSLVADRGQIVLDGRPAPIHNPLDAQRLGIGIVYQELDLFPHLTVGENLVIGNLKYQERLLVDRRAMSAFCRPFLAQVGLDLDANCWVASLSIAEQQRVVIARALSMQCRILLLDEPTSALSEDAAELLFAVIARLKSQGVSIIYVSHKMDEIFRLCDRLTVLRDGRTIGTCEIAAVTRADVIRMMVGRNVEVTSRAPRQQCETFALSVSHLTTHKLKDVSFELRRGEVLGIAGLVGAGRSELGAALFGLERIRHGTMQLNGRPLLPAGPGQAQRRGLGLVPEDRKQQGLMPHMSVRENGTLSILPQLGRWGFVRGAQESERFDPVARRLRLRCESTAAAIGTLSGGNQQKALLARELLVNPDVLFLDDPARGVDVAAKEDIYALIDDFAASGRSVLLASSELAELLRCSDRIMVLHDGRISGIFPASQVTQETIMMAATRADCA